MIQLIPYLTFSGNCREAMEFYQDCIGGELSFQDLSQSPNTEFLPEHLKPYIVKATLRNEDLVLIGTDMVDEGLVKGHSVSILLNCNNEDRIKTYYQKLGTGGGTTSPLQINHWGELFGGLTDKFGHHWLFHCNQNQSIKKYMDKTKFKSVGAYFKSLPPEALDRMKSIRKEIKEVAPLAEEVISYNMPALKFKGILVYYAAYARHIGFYAVPTTHEHFTKELSGYKTGKGSVQFPHEKPLPIELIKKMTKYRYDEKLKEK